MSMPLHWEDELPIGVQFTARYGDEETLYRLASQLEEARLWKDRLPPILTKAQSAKARSRGAAEPRSRGQERTLCSRQGE